jgi:hypothetical protein
MRDTYHLYYLGHQRSDQWCSIVMTTSAVSPLQKCGRLDPTFTSATLLFQKDPPANVQLFQVSTYSVCWYQGFCKPLLMING